LISFIKNTTDTHAHLTLANTPEHLREIGPEDPWIDEVATGTSLRENLKYVMQHL
jgi:hypothetical protein